MGSQSERKWFAAGGRHALENRASDLLGFLESDLSRKSAIDIGCAEGDLLMFLAERFGQVHGIEKSRSLFETAQSRVRNIKNCQLDQADIAHHTLSRDYDYTFFLGVLHYFRNEHDRYECLKELMTHTRELMFVRTMFRENRISRTPQKQLPKLQPKWTELTTVAKLCDELSFRWVFVDNRYRGVKDHRLGDLVVLERIVDGAQSRSVCFRER